MDQSLLVRKGSRILDILDSGGLHVLAAIWIRSEEQPTWRLWVVPSTDGMKQSEFYLRAAEIMAAANAAKWDIYAWDIQAVPADEPAMQALARRYETMEGGEVALSDEWLGGAFVTEGILLRMELPAPARTHSLGGMQ